MRRSSGLPHILKLYAKCDSYINSNIDMSVYQSIFENTKLDTEMKGFEEIEQEYVEFHSKINETQYKQMNNAFR